MTRREAVIRINRKAILFGIALYLLLYGLHIALLPVLSQLLEQGANASGLYGVHQLLGVVTCLGAGYLGGRIADERGFFYGFSIGGLGTIITALAALFWAAITSKPWPSLAMLPFWLVMNGFLAAFAGFLATADDKG
jgi:MFS family permease